MAELAIPLLGLASVYLLSNQKKKNVPMPLAASNAAFAEGYENMGKPANAIPNVSVPPDNYPVFKPNTGYSADDAVWRQVPAAPAGHVAHGQGRGRRRI